MKFHRLTLAGLFVAAVGLAGAAHAHENVYWSIGIGSPGVSVGVSSAPPVAVYPPVYMSPYPVVVAPRPIYYAPPAPVYYGPPPGWRHHHGHGHGGRGHWDGRRG